ncbi:MAG: hypothetical protein ACRDK3_04765, partial [Actinomycetota bacterium]
SPFTPGLRRHPAGWSEWSDAKTEALIRSSLATALSDLGSTSEAIVHREVAVAIMQGASDADEYRMQLAIEYEKAKRFLEAEKEYRRCIDLRQTACNDAKGDVERQEAGERLADAENHLAYMYAEQRIELDEGQRLVERALHRVRRERSPEAYGAMLDTRGWLRYLQGDFDGAVADLSDAIRIGRGQDATLDRHHLALAYEAIAATSQEEGKQHNLKLARLEWERIVELDPESSSATVARDRLATSSLSGRDLKSKSA